MLRWNNVSSGYHKKAILKNIQLTVNKSELLAVIGLNGSGKSTLLKTALGLLKPLQGEILLEDKTLESHPLKARAQKISLLESRSEVAFPITVRELLQVSARVPSDGQQSSRIERALGAVSLQGYEEKNLLELSSGEIQRAFMAHTLCANSEIIMLDEPFAHLDWNHQHELAESLIRWKKANNTTFVVAVHELEWAAKIADRICVLHQGQIVACGSPEEIFQNHDVSEVFAFHAAIDENPIDGSRRLTLGYQPRK